MSEKFPSSPSIELKDEKKEQDNVEARNTEFFLEAALNLLPNLTEDQRKKVAEHVRTQPGQWRHIDGKDVMLSDVRIQDGKVIFTIDLYGMEVEDDVPLE